MLRLSIIIPLYNEQETIIELLGRISKTDFKIPYEIIIIDDGSTDDSYTLVRDYIISKSLNNIFLFKKINEGKGSAIKCGINKTKGDIIAIQDADLEYDPQDLAKLVSYLIDLGEAYVIYGSRFLYKNNKKFYLPFHFLGNILLSLTTSLLYRTKITDMETCYKVFYKSALNKINLKNKKFGIEPEITINFIKKNLKIKEVPIPYEPRGYNKGKKIKMIDGIGALYILFKSRFKNE